MDDVSNNVLRYLENILPAKIIANNEELRNCNVVECKAKSGKSLDGFLSFIFQITLDLEDVTTKCRQSLNLIAKMIKNFEGTDIKADEMTFNELTFYSKILPNFTEISKQGGIEANWVPKLYYGFYGFDQDLNDGKKLEGVFIFENLTSDGYRMGPRDKLDEKHILLMTELIAKLHAASYAVKIQDREKFDDLVKTFKAFPFYEGKKNMFDAFYNIALERLNRHVTTTDQPDEYANAVQKIYTKYIEKPSKLLQKMLDEDEDFNTIIHGDYNRNNVMFKYGADEGFDDPVKVKTFDFQWAKYASPVLDLSFYLYMNLDPEVLASSWSRILKFYHDTLITTLASIIKCDLNDPRLEKIGYEKFLNHFADYAFYGCLIAAWFLPVMLADLETCKNIEIELTKDMFSTASMEVCLPAGGPDVIARINQNVMHAFKNGYLNRFLK